MKKLVVLIVAFCLSSVLFSQKLSESKVPVAVKKAFQSKYPNTKTTWEKEKGDYEANFKYNGKQMSVVISKSGTILETETVIPVSELPVTITSYISKHYKAKVTEAARIVDAKGETTYEAEIKGKDLLFDINGKFLKEVKHGKEEKEDKDDK